MKLESAHPINAVLLWRDPASSESYLTGVEVRLCKEGVVVIQDGTKKYITHISNVVLIIEEKED